MDRQLMKYDKYTNLLWLFKMAWRDGRKNISRLLLFVASIVFGIAALVAVYSLRENLQQSVNLQAADLLGADLVLSDNKPFDSSIVKISNTLNAETSEERRFASMVVFPKDSGTRLVQVRALAGKFPWYGSIETTPSAAGNSFRSGKQALVDKTLMLQFNAKVGDSVKVGEVTFLISGVLNKVPGQSNFSTSVAPIVYIPLAYVDATGLMQKGSRIGYYSYYKFPSGTDIDSVLKGLTPVLNKNGIDYQTVQTQKENTGRFFSDLTRFLALVGFIALLLGCIGVASSIYVYVREKTASIAILRCLGIRAPQAFFIFLVQIVVIGTIGSLLGIILGVVVQKLLPGVLKEFIPFDISTNVSITAIAQGLLIGILISVLFALIPLLSTRKISPLNALRISDDTSLKAADPLNILVAVLILCFIVVFTYLQLGGWVSSLFFTIGVVIALLILALVALTLRKTVRIFIQSSWSYLWRQGFSNLYRPNNQTIILIVSIGLSTAFICTLSFVKDSLVKQITVSDKENRSNMVLFDIQPEQKDAVAALTKAEKLPVLEQVPIVTVRIDEINGKTSSDIKDSSSPYSKWAYNSEFRVTYRDHLTETEKITAGKWVGSVSNDEKDVPVSLDERVAKSIPVKIGDHLVFNVQGKLVPAVVTSLREVDWRRIQTNFRIVFPRGVLEDAPQFHVLLTHVPSSKKSAQYQQAVVRQFPNISIIDLALVLATLDDILSKIGYVIYFMTGFSILTGLVVLITSVRISKYQRMEESVLLRTLGASRKQILTINALEYFFLGALSAITGILIALLGSWLLARYSFQFPFAPNFVPVLLLFVCITAITVIIGLLNSREVLTKPPLEVLRAKVQ